MIYQQKGFISSEDLGGSRFKEDLPVSIIQWEGSKPLAWVLAWQDVSLGCVWREWAANESEEIDEGKSFIGP